MKILSCYYGMINAQRTTSYIKHGAISSLSGVLARFKNTWNLEGSSFEMPSVSYT
jgi:hypothetical protein